MHCMQGEGTRPCVELSRCDQSDGPSCSRNLAASPGRRPRTGSGGAASQPAWLGPWYQFWQTTLRPYAPFLALVTAIIETAIALALIVGVARKPLYILGALWSFGVWAVPEGFGNTSRAASTDIGTSIIYVAVFAALWAIDSCAGPRRYSLDALIERHIPWWKRIAEVRNS